MLLSRLATLVTALGLSTLAHAAPTHYPLTVENCGSTLTFEQAPSRAVTIGQAGTEMLFALGLGRTLVGTSLWFNEVLAQYKPANVPIPRLADNEPSFESVIGSSRRAS